MKTSGVAQVSVLSSFEAEEPIAALIERVFGATPSIYSNMLEKVSVVTLYARTTPAELRKHRGQLEAGLKELEEMGINLGRAAIRFGKVAREDWSESWKKYFKTIHVGRALVIKPSWSKEKPAPGQATVVLDPGLSFGTGQHATTSFCLHQVVAQRPRFEGKRKFGGSVRTWQSRSLLDIGCGSGILAIAAAKLGYHPVDAFDFDPVAVRIARKNAFSNNVEGIVRVSRADLTQIPLQSRKEYNLICANVVTELLISERDRILNRLAPGGQIALAGILSTEFNLVRQAYEEAGLRLLKTKVEREWQSGLFG